MKGRACLSGRAQIHKPSPNENKELAACKTLATLSELKLTNAAFCSAPDYVTAQKSMARLSFIVAAAAAIGCTAFTAPARTSLALSTPVHISSRGARARLNQAPHAIDATPAGCAISSRCPPNWLMCTGPRKDGRPSRPAPSTTRMLSWHRARRPRAASAVRWIRTARATSACTRVTLSRPRGHVFGPNSDTTSL